MRQARHPGSAGAGGPVLGGDGGVLPPCPVHRQEVRVSSLASEVVVFDFRGVAASVSGLPPSTGSRSSWTMTSTAPSSKRHRPKPSRPLPRNRPNPVGAVPSISVQEPVSGFGKGRESGGSVEPRTMSAFDVCFRYLYSKVGARCVKGHHYQVLRPAGHQPD